MLVKLDGIHAYEITDRPGVRLCVGVPPGRTRPAMWLESPGTSNKPVILAQFHGENHACAAINFLDSTIDQINRVIKFLADEKGDDPV